MKERIQRPFKIILFPVLCFYTSAQVYAGIVDDNKALFTEYYDLAEAETQKPEFTNTLFKSYILFGRGNASNNMNVLYHTYKTTGDATKALYFLERKTEFNEFDRKERKAGTNHP